MTAGTLRQHAVAAEAIARGDLLFALYSGSLPPADDDQVWLLPDGNEPDVVAANWQREAAAIAAHAPGVRCRCSVLGAYPLDAGALDRITGMHVWSEGHLNGRLESGEHLHALIVRAWAAPESRPVAGDAPAWPADEDLLPALTDSAFSLLVTRLEQAPRGRATSRFRAIALNTRGERADSVSMERHGDTAAPAAPSRSSPRARRAAAHSRSARAHRATRERGSPFLMTRAGRLCALLAFAKLVLLLPILTRYGWHGDELYYLAAGRHLALGYVDFPPLVAVAGRLVDAIAGPSLSASRLAGSLFGVVAAIAAGAVARELGAGQKLQVLATAAWIATPFALGGATPALSPTFLELGATALALLAATRLLVSGEARQWLLLALWSGIGLEAKYTIAVPLAAFVIGCVLWRRELIMRREAAIAALIALALVIPNVIWQATHGWISLDFASTQHDATAGDSTPFVYAAQQLLFLGVGAVLVVLGLAWLWRRPQLRPLALASAAPTVLFALEQGRSYYALPAMLPALVAGCLALAERRPRRSTLLAFGGLHLAVLVIALPLVVPILPERQLVSTGTWNLSFWKDELGWRELTAQTARA